MSRDASRRPSQTGIVWVVAVIGVVVLVAGTMLGRAAGDDGVGPLATQDPGPAVQATTAVARLLANLAAVVVVGAFAWVTLCTRPEPSRRFGPMVTMRAHRCLRRASVWAWVWAVAALVALASHAALDSGVSFGQVHGLGAWVRLCRNAPQTPFWSTSIVLAVLLALLSRWVTLWRNVTPLLVLAVLALLPPLFTGHASSNTGHDLATGAIALHVPAAVLATGLLLTVLVELGRTRVPVADELRRYWWTSGICWALLGGSGLVLAGVLDPGLSLSGPYAVVLALKAALLVALVAVGLLGRRRVTRVLGSSDAPTGLRLARRLCVAELVLLAAAMVASAQLSVLTPRSLSLPVSDLQTLLGYELSAAPSFARLALDWRPEVLMIGLAVLLTAWYVVLWRRLRGRGGAWPVSRVVAWLAGWVVVVVATSSGLGRYEPAMFSVHMASHMLLTGLAPLLLVLGGPLTLAREAARPEARPLPGARDWVGLVEESPIVRVLTHPVVAVGLLAGLPFLVYFGGIFDRAAKYHWAHLLLGLVFLAAGYLFAWTVVGVDPTPRPLPSLARLGMLLAAMPFEALFAALVMSSDRIIGDSLAASNMYSALALPWVGSLAADQRLGGVVSLVVGEASVVLAAGVLAARWWQLDRPLFDTDLVGVRNLRGARVDRAPQPQAVGDDEQ